MIEVLFEKCPGFDLWYLHLQIIFLGPGMPLHDFNLSICEADTGDSMQIQNIWST